MCTEYRGNPNPSLPSLHVTREAIYLKIQKYKDSHLLSVTRLLPKSWNVVKVTVLHEGKDEVVLKFERVD